MTQQCFSILSMMMRFNMFLTKTHHLEVNQTLSVELFYLTGFLKREETRGTFFSMTFQLVPARQCRIKIKMLNCKTSKNDGFY